MFVESKSSSREVARTFHLHQATVLRWTHELGQRCLSAAEINHQLRPHWRGIVGLDGKVIRVAGRKMACLLAADLQTIDIPHCEVVGAEDEANCRRFLQHLRQQVPCIRGLVSDLGRGRVWIKLIAEIFPEVPHQACIVHFDRYVEQSLPKSEQSPHHATNQLLRQLMKNLLYATHFNDAEEIFLRLQRAQDRFRAGYQRTVLKSLQKHFDLLTAHFHHPELDSTNNVTENIIKQLDRKIFLLNDFDSAQAALNFIKLWVLCYRFRPFSSSNYDFRNGLSPLQLAGVETEHMDWLDFALNPNN